MKLYFGNTVTTVTTVMILALLGFIVYSFFHRSNIEFWGCKGLLLSSKLSHILTDTPELLRYEVPAGTFIPYKGRAYCWTTISASGEITLTE